jgi:hypothetical protein
MKRLDQGHLHPKTRGPRTDMSRPGIEPGRPRWEASTLEKSHLNSLLIAIRNIYIWALDQGENARDTTTVASWIQIRILLVGGFGSDSQNDPHNNKKYEMFFRSWISYWWVGGLSWILKSFLDVLDMSFLDRKKKNFLQHFFLNF